MAVGRTHSVSLLGLRGAVVEIEADISSNLPGFLIIGLPDTALGEARDRVRAATVNSARKACRCVCDSSLSRQQGRRPISMSRTWRAC